MAEFNTAHALTSSNEGGYANNPADSGGETFFGIARNSWPRWNGWQGIDAAKKTLLAPPPYGTREYRNWVSHLNKVLDSSPLLKTYVKSFYLANFWDKYRLGEIENQEVANWIYDHAVNASSRGIKWAQEAAGAVVDGDCGPKTIAAINAHDPVKLLQEMEDVAAFYRLDKALANPSQTQFLPSWLRRDNVSKDEIDQVMVAARDGLTYSEVVKLKAIVLATA